MVSRSQIEGWWDRMPVRERRERLGCSHRDGRRSLCFRRLSTQEMTSVLLVYSRRSKFQNGARS